VAGIVAGIVMFLWGLVSHSVLPTRTMGLKNLPAEEAVLSVMRKAVPEPGVYFFPGMDLTRKPTPAEQKAWMARIKSGPTGLLVYQPAGEGFSAKQILIELLSNIVAGMVAAFVIGGLAGGFGPRLAASTALGFVAWFSISVPYWNWYGFSRAFSLSELVDQVGGWFCAGLVFAAMTRKKAG
jgi:hypothetical protein